MKGSKKEERMLILNMVNEGKITVEESIKLLEAMNEEEAEYTNYAPNEFDERLNSFTANLESFTKDIGERAKTTYKDFEPKLKNATKTVVEKTVGLLADITDSLNESLKNMEQGECNCEKECESHQECQEHQECPEEEPQPNDNEPTEN